ncbi:unnamed protein product [Schistocephalus solidus]|uniref:Uncharacterized protein n=1 Tax=Schistocephalus solidus TaxID=70667 RepID=A0A183T6J5_SCHSO|nr:unnamed protein product [Schistocephalus solidus]
MQPRFGYEEHRSIDTPTDKISTVSFPTNTVRKTLKQLQSTKLPGPDIISANFLNELTDKLASPLSKIFENSMEVGALPTKLKLANITPIYKEGEEISLNSFKPVTLTIICCSGESTHTSSLLDKSRSKRLERWTAIVTRELARYKVDIAALSETRFSEQDQLEEVGAGYTFFWSGRTKAERRDAGVAFAIRNAIVGRLPCLLQGINDRLMSLRLPLQRDRFATTISAYATQ